jgi:glycosyltransferase involved in cell wall biosynthesis
VRPRSDSVGGSDAPRKNGAPHPPVSIVVPTRNEAGNIAQLLDELEAALPAGSEIVFVDDSTDATPDVIEAERDRQSLRVSLVHRPEEERGDGLAGAVVRGLEVTSAPWVCVMDADLQHPPQLVPRLLARAEAGDVDVVIGSRYCDEGSVESFGGGRSLLSKVSTFAAKVSFPGSLRGVSDPMSGFFLVRRSAVALERLRPRGFKILLEILVRTPGLRVAEVPFRFGERHAGESKASLTEARRYVWQLIALHLDSSLLRFLTVGLTGLVVNSLAFLFCTGVLHLNYVLAAILATQVSTTWNFALVERWAFGRRRRAHSRGTRFATFLALNNLALLLRVPALAVLVSVLGINAGIANLLTLIGLFAARFLVADRLIWAGSDGVEGELSWYRIHDEVTVESEVRLRELERFRVPEAILEPTIRVRIGHLSRQQSDLVASLAPNVRHVRYDEGLGRLGFAVDIAWNRRVEIVASPLLRYSPHVLYTNVVEPTLRWCFVRRGYALAHGACIAVNGEATLITAKTDTGKTTTILKTLDRYPASFLADDLTLVAADGRVLMYPKPLTISRHTAASVKTPLLSSRERLALVLQSRVHSRTGRRFAQLIARLRLPAATINAYVQLLVPPPKYHVERLVPDVDVVTDAWLAGFVLIERGGSGEAPLPDDVAVDVLLANTEDAYGFPPYPALEHFLHSGDGRDLRLDERAILASALGQVEAVVLRSETMDWWQRVAALAGLDTQRAEPAAPVGELMVSPVPTAAE